MALAAVLIGTVGCKTIPTDSSTAFASGVTAVRTQSKEAFCGANDLIADASFRETTAALRGSLKRVDDADAELTAALKAC